MSSTRKFILFIKLLPLFNASHHIHHHGLLGNAHYSHLIGDTTESFHDSAGGFGSYANHNGHYGGHGYLKSGHSHGIGHSGFSSMWGSENHGKFGHGGIYGENGSLWGSENIDAFGQRGIYNEGGSSWGGENASARGQAGTYGASGAFGSRMPGNGYGDYGYIRHEGYGGLKQDHLTGFHGIDYDLFGNGTLNHSYSKNLDRSYYGKGDSHNSEASLLSRWGFNNDRYAVGGSRCGTECSESGVLGPWGTGSTSSGGVGLCGGTYLSSIGLSDGRSVQSANIVGGMIHGGHGLGHGDIGVHGSTGHGEGLAVGSVTANGNGLVLESLSHHGFGGVIAGISASGAKGKTFKFTEKSIEASLSDYNRFFTASKLFTFNPAIISTYKIVLVSTTKGYHPQLKILEINKGGNEKYIEQYGEDKANGIYSSRYALRSDREYLLEIGASEKIDFTPFTNINTGGFICIISAEKRSLQEILAQHDYKVMMWGKTAEVPLAHTEVLELSGDGKKEGCGRLDYSVTAFYNQHKESVTIFFHNETSFSNGISGTSHEAAQVEFVCDHTGNPHKIFQGVEIKRKIVEFIIHCKTVCDLIDMLI